MGEIESAILSSFRAGILAIRSDGTVSFINPIGAKILEGCSIREGENIHPRAGENVFFRSLSEALSMSYLPTRVEAELPGRDGERQNLGFTLSELKKGETRVGICAFFKDLTHVEMTEESENLKERLLMLGQMAAGLAHEIRNPIASIGVHASFLKTHLSGNEKLLSSVGMMSREVEKVEYIIRECLNFVRPAELGIQPVRVDTLVDGVVARMVNLHPGMKFSVQKPSNGDLIGGRGCRPARAGADEHPCQRRGCLPGERDRHGLPEDVPPLYRVGSPEPACRNAPSRPVGEGGAVPPDPHP